MVAPSKLSLGGKATNPRKRTHLPSSALHIPMHCHPEDPRVEGPMNNASWSWGKRSEGSASAFANRKGQPARRGVPHVPRLRHGKTECVTTRPRLGAPSFSPFSGERVGKHEPSINSVSAPAVAATLCAQGPRDRSSSRVEVRSFGPGKGHHAGRTNPPNPFLPTGMLRLRRV
jgi:hypothetical protein